MFQTPFADRIRNEVGVPTIAVGAISEADHVNSIIAAGRADLCAVARPHLANPAWTLHEAARIGWGGVAWPPQYASGRRQFEAKAAACSERRRPPIRSSPRAHDDRRPLSDSSTTRPATSAGTAATTAAWPPSR
jgi:anthraniloyl-CoA monooxygenase